MPADNMHGPDDIRFENVSEATIIESTKAIICTISGCPTPSQANFDELLAGGLEWRYGPIRVFDFVDLFERVPDGYRAMHERKAIKVMIKY